MLSISISCRLSSTDICCHFRVLVFSNDSLSIAFPPLLTGHAFDMLKSAKKLFGTAGEVNPAIGAEYSGTSFQFCYVVKKRSLAEVTFKRNLSVRYESGGSH